MTHTGKSEETMRRWIRSVRNQFQIDLDDTNEVLEQKTAFLRKQNETQPDGAARRDKHGLPVFDWLLLRGALDETFPAEDRQSPTSPLTAYPHSPSEDTNDDAQRTAEDTPDHTQSEKGSPDESVSEGTQDNTHQPSEDTNDPRQEEYMWMPKAVYEGLLFQLEAKDAQLSRKDNQLDAEQERSREHNFLLQGYQRHFGALPSPTGQADVREDTPSNEEEQPIN